ncbi:MAG: peptide ABC transporter substrate-binding protein, partial [Thermomicrobiaceae bacterium]|nr:peptide ABC transporter substrate-binding protein [Thermomicrobiaceae bacterium]
TSGGGGTTPAAGGSPAAGATEAPGNEELAAEQVFRWNTENEPLSMDFNKDLYCMGIEVLWGCLGQFNENLEAVPDIAEKWEPNEDGSVWTFHIRKDTKWSNGDPVTAHDFEYAWKRQLDPATAATYAGFLYDLKNGEAFNQGKSGVTRDDVGVKAIDDYTLEATLEGPRAYFPVLTAYYASIPVHKASIDKYGDKWTEPPNGVFNGPFKLTEWKHNERLVAEKNENYWNAKNIHITRIERPVISADTAPQAYENDEIDYLQRINLGDLDRYQNDPELSKQMIKYNQFGTWYLVPDPNFEPFKLKQVRQAMAHAIDRDTIVNKVLKGLGTPAYTMTPPGMPGYNPNKYEELTRYEGPDAKKYLQGTPYEGGKNWPKLTMTMREETDAEKAAGEAIINMLKQNLGMDLELEVGEPKETYERMYKHEIPLMWVRWYID